MIFNINLRFDDFEYDGYLLMNKNFDWWFWYKFKGWWFWINLRVDDFEYDWYLIMNKNFEYLMIWIWIN